MPLYGHTKSNDSLTHLTKGPDNLKFGKRNSPGKYPVPLLKAENDLDNVGDLVAVGARLFFTNHNQLWKSDGTSAGTVRVKDIASHEQGETEDGTSYRNR